MKRILLFKQLLTLIMRLIKKKITKNTQKNQKPKKQNKQNKENPPQKQHLTAWLLK